MIKPLAYPILLINDMLALPGKSANFSTLELRSGYWQVTLYIADKEKAELACHIVLYQFRVIPFRLANASKILQQVMLMVLVAQSQLIC